MSVLTVENLSFQNFGPFNFSIEKSECIGITGASGAGKTLLLRAISDMDTHSGKILLNGIVSSEIPAPEWRTKVALLPAESAWWHETVGEHIKDIDHEWLKALSFDSSVINWHVSRLSTGERQRLSLLRLLSNKPDVLLLDEPTANLDAERTLQVENFIESYKSENRASIIWVGHNLEQLKKVSDQRYIIEKGSFKKREGASL
ncbi:MAG: ABC transporter ATP-binding protein [Desulfobacterales bacterium]|nr:ABC transporter ATP-binding protein [Desulfobacterales bacterium]